MLCNASYVIELCNYYTKVNRVPAPLGVPANGASSSGGAC